MVNYDNNYATAAIMEHLWKTTREKLLSGKNNFRNENDLLLPICNVCDIFFPLCCFAMRVQQRGDGREKNGVGGESEKENLFIIMLLLFPLFLHLNGELLIEVRALICCLCSTVGSFCQ